MSRKNKRPWGRRRRAAKYDIVLRTPHVAGFNLPAGQQRETDESLAPQTARFHHGSRRRDLDDVLNYATPASRIDHDLPRIYVWRGSLNPSAVRLWEQIKDVVPKNIDDLDAFEGAEAQARTAAKRKHDSERDRARRARVRAEKQAEAAAAAEAEGYVRAKWTGRKDWYNHDAYPEYNE